MNDQTEAQLIADLFAGSPQINAEPAPPEPTEGNVARDEGGNPSARADDSTEFIRSLFHNN
jgi:hypothetical protein